MSRVSDACHECTDSRVKAVAMCDALAMYSSRPVLVHHHRAINRLNSHRPLTNPRRPPRTTLLHSSDNPDSRSAKSTPRRSLANQQPLHHTSHTTPRFGRPIPYLGIRIQWPCMLLFKQATTTRFPVPSRPRRPSTRKRLARLIHSHSQSLNRDPSEACRRVVTSAAG